jgi:xylulokinase
MQFLGIDIGSSSIKASVIDGETGVCLASASYPETELQIDSPQAGWAEQNPETWWESVKGAIHLLQKSNAFDKNNIKAIGIAYQMHGLVAVDKNQIPVRPSIIWCDSRAVEIGEKAFKEISEEFCLENYLNSPGNFTASKLRWVKENEPEVFKRIHKIMLPGDYIALKMTGKINTTISGLSEGILWNFKENKIAISLLDHFNIDKTLIPEIVPTFGQQGELSQNAAIELGLSPGTKITYRAGDQPNNALSLNVLKPGEIAATAGTSGVIYGVSEKIKYDPLSRVNTFIHVNHTLKKTRLGVLLCINGTGILNSWLKKLTGTESYEEMNLLASNIPIGSDGLIILPFGNGAERIFQNKNMGSKILNLDFNRHTKGHIIRAAHEGIAFSFKYGMEIMEKTGIKAKIIRAGKANMFLSPVFRETLAGISGATIELYNTDGSIGAARGAAIGSGYYKNEDKAFANLKIEEIIQIEKNEEMEYAYQNWKNELNTNL